MEDIIDLLQGLRPSGGVFLDADVSASWCICAQVAPDDCLLGQLAELLFPEAIRRYLTTQTRGATGWTAGLRDPVIGRALALLHGRMARRRTTEELAQHVNLSRSAFANRFPRAIGEPQPAIIWRRTQTHETSDLADRRREPGKAC